MALARRRALADADRRHGRPRSATPCNGCKEPRALDLDSHGTRAVVCPAKQPDHEAVEILAEAWEQGPGLFQWDIELGDMARLRIAQWAAPGVPILARPWPHRGPLLPKDDVPLACPHGTVTCPHGQTVPMVLGTNAQFPARACAGCPMRAPCPTARRGPGRSLTIRADEPFPQTLRAKRKTKRGRAAWRTRTAVEHAIASHGAQRGWRAREKGLRKNPCDGRRHAALRNLLVAARYKEERPLAS